MSPNPEHYILIFIINLFDIVHDQPINGTILTTESQINTPANPLEILDYIVYGIIGFVVICIPIN